MLRKVLAASAVVLVVITVSAFAQVNYPMYQSIFFGPPGGNDPDITVSRDPSSSTPQLEMKFGTSDVEHFSFGASGLIMEGTTDDAYELTIVAEPTSDQTLTFPDMGASFAFLATTLTTNAANVANSIWGASNALVFEGATANDFELSLAPADVAADRTVTIPDMGAASVLVASTLATNAFAAANSIWGASNALVLEGATADDFETSITVTDPTADKTVTIPNATFTVGQIQVTCTASLFTDAIDKSCFIADRAYTITRIDEVHTVAEAGGTLTIMPRKQVGTEAPASGDALLSAAFNGLGTAETVQNGSLTATGADLILAAGNRIGLDFTDDTAGELSGVVVTFTLIPS